MKIDIELVKNTLLRANIDLQITTQILQDLMFEARVRKEEFEEKEPKTKKQFVVIVNDPYGKIQELDCDFQGWIVQIPEDQSERRVLQKIHNAISDFNITPKGRKMPIKDITNACWYISEKIFKEHKIWVKTKQPVLLIPSANKILKN
ncbi:MAG: hypothetical protein J6K91_09105 [Opitutales bacterium]|nr:hypothetical protein [Opitutales bacterium]